MLFYNEEQHYKEDNDIRNTSSSINIIDSGLNSFPNFSQLDKNAPSLLLKNDMQFLDSSTSIPLTFTSVFNLRTFQIIKNHFKSIFKIKYSDEFFADVYSNKYYSVIGLHKQTKEVICFAHIDIDKINKKAQILTIGVVKEYQNKKLGKKLLNKVIEELTLIGILEISLIVQEVNEVAVRLYKSQGFSIYKSLNDYYSISPTLNSNENRALQMNLKINIKKIWLVEVFKKFTSYIK